MKSCPNCGWSNEESNRFCENCGADLQVLAKPTGTSGEGQPGWLPPGQPQATTARPWEAPPKSPDWRMSPLPEEEVPTPKRRVWVWLVVGSLVLCLAICVALLVWAQYTPSGRNFQTRIAEETTAEAGE